MCHETAQESVFTWSIPGAFSNLGFGFSFVLLSLILFSPKFKMTPKNAGEVEVSGRQFHGSTPVWSIGQIMAMNGFF